MIDSLIKYGLVACFFSLVLTPFGLPIPEEISLLATGFIVKKQSSSLLIGWIIGFLGVTLGDLISWTMGRTVGLEPKGFVAKLIGPDQIRDIEQFYRKWGDWAIVIARQIPGMRFPTFFFAGASAIPLGRFYLIDGLAALITVNVFFTLGYVFADDLSDIQLFVQDFQSYASTFAAILIILIISFLLYRRLRSKK
jgi:membrane protein DedA with SNARE-associated domain